MITWKDIINIACTMFEIDQKQLAKNLNVDQSTLSRIKNGKSKHSFTKNAMFKNVFSANAPARPDDAIKEMKETEGDLLDLLKFIIESNFETVRIDMNDYWMGSDYKNFVKRLLILAEQGSLSKMREQSYDKTPTTAEATPKLTPIRRPKRANSSKAQLPPLTDAETETAKNLPPSGTVDAFYQSIQNFPIETFIESNPADSLSQNTLWDAISFWGKMDCQQMQENDPDRDTEVYIHIIEFLSELEKYIAFLRSHSINAEAFPDGFQLANCDCEELDGEINCYQQRLKSLFQIAVSETETEISNRLKEQQKTRKKAGIYEHLPRN